MNHAEVPVDLPRPQDDPLSREFFLHAIEHRLVVQACECGHMQFPGGPVCSVCLGNRLRWHQTKGTGSLMAWADFHRAYWAGLRGDLPYRVCVVKLDEGPLLVSNLPMDDTGIRIGARVRVRFDDIGPNLTLPRFEIESGPESTRQK
jgi:uncharacterized protein